MNALFIQALVIACEEAIEAQQWAILTASAVASFSYKVVAKAIVRGVRRGATKSPKVKVRLNSAEKRQQITLHCKAKAAARAAKAKQEEVEVASNGNIISDIKKAARAAQSSAQKAVNAVRKIENIINGKKTRIKKSKPITITGIISVKADNASISQRDSWHKLTHVTKSTNNKIVNAKDEFKTFAKVKEEKIKQDKVNRAKAQAIKEERIKLRKEKIARICAKAWYDKGIWVPQQAANDCVSGVYEVREKAYTQLLALVGEAS